MKERAITLANSELFQILMSSVFAQTAFTVVMLMTLQIPPDAILDSGLQEIILVFEG